MNKVYLAMEYYWNGEDHEDFEEKDTPIRAFKSKEETEEFIKSMPIPVKEMNYGSGQYGKCEELEKKESGYWKRAGDEENRIVLCEIEDALRAFALRNMYTDQAYAYYISEIPFGKEEEDE